MKDVSKFCQVNAWGYSGVGLVSKAKVDRGLSADLEAQEWNGDQPCQVPRLSSPLVIGTEIVEPKSEAFVWETLSCHGHEGWFNELWIWLVMLRHLRITVSREC